MTTKKELQEQLKSMETEANKLREQIDDMPDDEPANGFGLLFVPEPDDMAWIVRQDDFNGKFEVYWSRMNRDEIWATTFRAEEEAQLYADQCNAELELMMCERCRPFVEGKDNYSITWDYQANRPGFLYTQGRYQYSPFNFPTFDLAEAAAEKLGDKKIKQLFMIKG